MTDPQLPPSRRFRRQRLERDAAVVSRARLKRTVLRVIAGVAAVAVLVAGGFFVKLRSNFRTAPLSLGNSQVSLEDGPLDILLLGTDTRAGANGVYGGAEYTSGKGHSDVMMLVHVAADRQRVTVVSFPRDTLVPLPSCTDPTTKKVYPAQDLAMLNYALSYGGPGCTVAAVNKLTGLNIDHFMMADFTAVKEISRAVGGVEVCVNQTVTDTMSGLKLPAGVSTVEGDQALAFLRTRHGFADGGDIGRIRAQQSFMASLARKVKSEQTLTDLPKMYSIADAMTKNLTVDQGLSNIPTLIAVAKQMSEAPLGDISFVTMPTKVYEPDPNRLEVDTAKAEKLFTLLRSDGDVTANPSASTTASPAASTKAVSTPAASPHTSSSASPSATTAPSPTAAASSSTPMPTDSAVQIDRSLVPASTLNASGSTSRPTQIIALMKKLGYGDITNFGKAPSTIPITQILYQEGYLEAAQDLAKTLKIDDAQLIRTASVQGIQLVVGQDFASGSTVEQKKATVSGGLSGQTAAQVTCQQTNPNE
jgi:LCP family protein required for cell wall assembly